MTVTDTLDRAELVRLYDEHSPELYRYAYRLLGAQELAEECVADTFTRFLKALQEKRGPRNHLRAYLYRIAHNWIIDYFRKQKPVDGLDEHAEFIQAEQVSPENQVINNELAGQIRQYLARLTPEQSQVVALKHLEGMSNEEVAEIMERNVGSVKALNSRALENFRKFMRQDGLAI